MARLAVYIDGFNFYHAVDDLDRAHLKWVDLFQLAELVAQPGEQVVAVRYFSAFADWLPGPYQRHRQYVAALRFRGVDCVMAHFKCKQMKCFKCNATWTSREEKETDVHLALRLLSDAEDDAFDRAILISGDSDLVPVVNMVKSRHPGKRITIAAPPGRHGAGRHLQHAAGSDFPLTKGKLAKCLLPSVLVDGNGNTVATRPSEYDPPR